MNAQKIKLCLFSSAVIFLFAGCNSNNQTKNYPTLCSKCTKLSKKNLELNFSMFT